MPKNERHDRIAHVLLGLFLILLAAHPLGPGSLPGRGIQAAIFAFAIALIGSERKLLAAGLALGVPTILLVLLPARTGGIATPIASMALIFFLSAVLFRRLVRRPVVTGGALSGALIIYLLLGLLWFHAYVLTESLLPGSFYGAAAEGMATPPKALFYYSFVTLTTLGYGDVGPVSEWARSLAVTQAVVGQLYLAVLIASRSRRSRG